MPLSLYRAMLGERNLLGVNLGWRLFVGIWRPRCRQFASQFAIGTKDVRVAFFYRSNAFVLHDNDSLDLPKLPLTRR
jgi:hypothetical protein